MTLIRDVVASIVSIGRVETLRVHSLSGKKESMDAQNYQAANDINTPSSSQELIQKLCEKDSIFSTIFSTYLTSPSLAPDIKLKAKELFKEVCPNTDFDVFLNQWVIEQMNNEFDTQIQEPAQNQNSDICSEYAFDPKYRRFVKPFAAPPIKYGSRRKLQYDAYKCVLEKDEKGEFFILNFNIYSPEEEIVENNFAETEKEYVKADHSIGKCASISTEVSNMISYQLLEVKGESRIR